MVRHKSACKPHRKEETHNLSEVRLQLGYRNNCFFFDTNPSIFNRCATMPMIIFRTWATCDLILIIYLRKQVITTSCMAAELES